MKNRVVKNLPLHFIAGFDGTKITPEVKELIRRGVGGFILFKRNIENPKQVRSLNQRLQKLSARPLLLGVDQEGGPVARLKTPFTTLPPMSVVGDYYRKTKDKKAVMEVGRLLGREVRAVGFNWDYAPVVDVHSNPKNPVIGKRSFSPDPLIVARCAEALTRGLHAEGVLSCAKHFPGHGATIADSHKDLPVLKAAGRLIWKRDVLPYRHLIKEHMLASVMTAHVMYPDLDEDFCATLSEEILGKMLRTRMKYRGLIVSDDLFMKAIADHWDLSAAATRFLTIGGDIVLMCHHPEILLALLDKVEKDALASRVLRQKMERAQKRIFKALSLFGNSPLPPLSVIGAPAHKELIGHILKVAQATLDI